MSDRPLLRIGDPVVEQRETGGSRFLPKPHLPSAERQQERHGPVFARLRGILERDDPSLEFQADPVGIAPDRALVFEVAGSIEGFAAQAESLGFRFLGEQDEFFDPDDDFYMDRAEEDKVRGSVYLLMPDLQAMRELLGFWDRYRRGEDFPWGRRKWKALFDQLRDIRPWGPQDRVTERFEDAFLLWSQSDGGEPFRFEIDLWFSRTPSIRDHAVEKISEALRNIGGRYLSFAIIEPINYFGVLAEIPVEARESCQDAMSCPLVNLDCVQYLNPRAMAIFNTNKALGEADVKNESVDGEPIAALLDGYPLVNHQALQGGLTIDDFLDIEHRCPAMKRSHGTSMASLILHGDMHAESDYSVESLLLAMPVMVADERGGDCEKIPDEMLTIDLVHRAVKRMKEGEGEESPVGERVVVINHSLADRNSPYAGSISAWGRLLDYLSFKYRVLFVVAAGNYMHKVPLKGCSRLSDFERLDSDKKEKCVIEALLADMSSRQVMNPAEALNVLTVGAWNADESQNKELPNTMFCFPREGRGPSIVSAVGLGHKRSLKPDVFYNGGRSVFRVMPDGDCLSLFPIRGAGKFVGQKVAAPRSEGNISGISNTSGTSNSAALMTRNAVLLHQVLDQLAQEDERFVVPQEYKAVLLKALLIHGCKWPRSAQDMEGYVEPQGGRKWSPRRTNISRLLGLGCPDIERVMECTRQRATMLGWGAIRVDTQHTVSLPLPESLSRQNEFRRLTITIAWFSPINSSNKQYRRGVLKIASLDAKECGTGRSEALQPPTTVVENGTVTHAVYEGVQAVEIGDHLDIVIKCSQQAGGLDDDIPYAVVASFEVGQESEIDVYEEIREKLHVEVAEKVRL